VGDGPLLVGVGMLEGVGAKEGMGNLLVGGGGRATLSGVGTRLKGLLVTGSIWIKPWSPLDCLRSLFNANGRSFSSSACSFIDNGRGRFSPETRRGEDEGNETGVGREGVGICDLKGDFDTRLLLWTCL